MDLILWRHAEAEEGSPDLERKLTARGRKHAERVAEWLRQRLPSKYSVLTSPARRARETAQALEPNPDIEPRLAPDTSAKEVLKAVGWPGRKGVVILVGHQPTLGRIAARVLGNVEAEWTVKKGGLWWFTHRERDGAEEVVVRAVIAPDLA